MVFSRGDAQAIKMTSFILYCSIQKISSSIHLAYEVRYLKQLLFHIIHYWLFLCLQKKFPWLASNYIITSNLYKGKSL